MRGIGGALVLLAAAAAGCHGGPIAGRGAPAPSISRSLTPVVTADRLVVQSVLLERPISDSYLDRDLWDSALPAGSPEVRVLLEQNGLRAGIIGGSLPQRFQDLLNSESETVNPHEMTFEIRKDAVIPTAGPVDPCRFTLLTELSGKRRPVELTKARCGILVRPEAADDGGVRIWCEPQLQHGERRERYRPNEDGTGLTKFEEVPLERFPTLGFEAALAPGECLVIGTKSDQMETLGAALFSAEAEDRPRQRVLVIRARQGSRAATSELPVIAGPYRPRR